MQLLTLISEKVRKIIVAIKATLSYNKKCLYDKTEGFFPQFGCHLWVHLVQVKAMSIATTKKKKKKIGLYVLTVAYRLNWWVLPEEKQILFQWHKAQNFLSFLSSKTSATWSAIHWEKILILLSPLHAQMFEHSQIKVHGKSRQISILAEERKNRSTTI